MSVTRHLHSLQRPILATTMRCMAAFVHAFAMYCRHEGVWKMKLVSGTRSFTERRIPSLRLTDHISGNAKSDAIIGFFQGTSSSDCSQCNPSSAEWAVAWLSEGIRRVYIYIYGVPVEVWTHTISLLQAKEREKWGPYLPAAKDTSS